MKGQNFTFKLSLWLLCEDELEGAAREVERFQKYLGGKLTAP